MKDKTEIFIPEPCSADWEAMTPHGQGRHCALCEKTVVDFTVMSEAEIKTYFRENAGKKTCGHFYRHQVVSGGNAVQRYFGQLYRRAYFGLRWHVARAVVLGVLGLVLFCTGCRKTMSGELKKQDQVVTGAIVPDPKNQGHDSNQFSGDTIVYPPTDTLKQDN